MSGKEKGIDFELGAPVTRIIKKDGRIAGVICERDGEEIEVAARTVLVASGGYANNKQWIKRYCGFDLDTNIMPIGNVDKMGDGIRMAFEVGAAEEGLGVLEAYAAGPFGEGFAMKGPAQRWPLHNPTFGSIRGVKGFATKASLSTIPPWATLTEDTRKATLTDSSTIQSFRS